MSLLYEQMKFIIKQCRLDGQSQLKIIIQKQQPFKIGKLHGQSFVQQHLHSDTITIPNIRVLKNLIGSMMCSRSLHGTMEEIQYI